MIYGISFNGSPIPEGVARLFPKELKRYRCCNCGAERAARKQPHNGMLACACCERACAHNLVRGLRAILVGIGQDEQERDTMQIQMSNGHRMVHVEAKQTAGGVWYGFYS